MDQDLAGKTALVTGSGRNNGRATLLEFAARGANVIVNARSNAEEANEVKDAAESLGAKAIVVLGDVSKQETLDEIKESSEAAFGSVDIYVSNAATRPHQSFFDTPIEDWLAVLDVQLNASFRLAKTFVPGMVEKHWGRIIHITGPDALVGSKNRAHNVAAKGGIRGLTKALALELGPYGITVNDVAPGSIDGVNKELSHPTITPDTRDKFKGNKRLDSIPVGRTGKPEDIAYACGFYASPRADFFTGTLLCAFGGKWMVG